MIMKFWQMSFLTALSVADTHNRGENVSANSSVVIPSSSDFRSIRNSRLFVDKTLYIKEWLTNGPQHRYVTAPPRFGKSTLLNMMRRFLAAEVTVVNGSIHTNNCNETIDHQLFLNTDVFMQEETLFYAHFKQYTVIPISFAPMGLVKNHETFVDEMCYVIYKMFAPFKFLEGYSGLSADHKKILRQYGDDHRKFCIENFEIARRAGAELVELAHTVLKRRIILLGDDYDGILHAHLFRDIVHDSENIQIDLQVGMKSLVKNEMDSKPDAYVGRSLVIGSLNVGGMMTLSNNIHHFDFFHDEKTAKFFGVCEKEAKSLLAEFSLSDKYDIMEEWLDGYTVVGSDLHLFNIMAVISFITEGQKLELTHTQFSSVKTVTKPYLHLFSDHRVGFSITESIFGGSTAIDRLHNVQYTELVELKNSVSCATGPNSDYQLTPEKVSIFMTFLLELGLFAVINETNRHRVIKPTNRENVIILRERLLESGYYDKTFRHNEQQKLDFRNAMKRLKANNESMNALGEAVYKLFSKNPPNAEYPFMACLFTYAVEASEEVKLAFKVDGAINLFRDAFNKRNEKVRRVNATLDFIAYWEGELMVIVDGKFNCTATEGLDQALTKRYYDVRKNDEFSKMNFKHLILAGLNINGGSGTVSVNYLIDSFDVMDSIVLTCNENGTKVEQRRDM